MPTSKSKKTPKKRIKLRPYRVDYFLHDEMLKDKALVRSKVIRAVNAEEAKDRLVGHVSGGDYRPLTIIRAYRFYKKLSAEPIKKTYLPLDKLFSAKRAIEIMTQIENPKKPIAVCPEDLGIKPKVGDPQPATPVGEYPAESIKILEGMSKRVDPTTLPADHPDHVCTDKCYSFTVIEGSTSEVAEQLRQMSEKPKSPEVFIPEWGATVKEIPTTGEKLPPDYFDTSNVAAGQPAPLTFPDKPCAPVKDAVFDGPSPAVCRWHGSKYMVWDKKKGDHRCSALDSGSEYLNSLYGSKFYPAKALPEEARDLDAAAPVIWSKPEDKVYTVADEGWLPPAGQGRDFVEQPTTLTVTREKKPYKVTMGVFCGTILTIVGLVYLFFKYVAK